MNLYFYLNVRFVCKSCKCSFKYVDQFVEHKIKIHLVELQNAQCIVFEENEEIQTNIDEQILTTESKTPESASYSGTAPEKISTTKRSVRSDPTNHTDGKHLIKRKKQNISIKVSNSTESSPFQPSPLAGILKQEPSFHFDPEENENELYQSQTEPHEQEISSLALQLSSASESNSKNVEIDIGTDHVIDIVNVKCEYEDENNYNDFENEDDEPRGNLVGRSISNLISPNHDSASCFDHSIAPYSNVSHLMASEISNNSSDPSNYITPFETSSHFGTRNNSHSNHINSVIIPSADYSSRSGSDALLNRQLFNANHSNNFTMCLNETIAESSDSTPNFLDHSQNILENRIEFGYEFVPRNPHRPFKCQVPDCDSAFSKAYSLNAHMKIKHSGNGFKKFVCHFCQKRFYTKGELNMHFVVHSDERPYKCPHDGCPSAYKRKNKLIKHLRTHHKDSPFLQNS